MLVLNISMPNKEKDWILIETKQGIIAVSARNEGSQLRLLIEAPRSVNIARKSRLIEKEKLNETKTD